MSARQIQEAFSACNMIILMYEEETRLNIEPKKADYPGTAKSRGRTEVLSHARWMCQEAKRFLDENPCKIEKANRWLGCVQWSLWILGLVSLEELKDMNRSKDTSLFHHQV